MTKTRAAVRAFLIFVWVAIYPGMSMAQELSLPDTPVITIEPDKLFGATQYGQRIARELEKRGTRLAGENRRIEDELGQEESELTALRATMEAAAFRDLADAFDAKVQKVRTEQDEKARVLARMSEDAQFDFLQAIIPILDRMMIERGASVILDRRAVFYSADASDITQDAIARIDAELGDGTAAQDAPLQNTADTPAD